MRPSPSQLAVRALHPSSDTARVLNTDVLHVIAAGLAASVLTATAPESAGAGAVRRIRLLSTNGYDAWLMVWGPGAVAGSHDHSGSVSVVAVAVGSLIERSGGASESSTRIITPGQPAALSAIDHHVVSNGADGMTLSVHAYSPPLKP